MSNPTHITEPSKWGYQVRIARNKITINGYFSHREWGGKRKSKKAAKNWVAQTKTVLGDTKLSKLPCFPNKKTDCERGVTRALCYDKRRDCWTVEYQAFWILDKRKRTRKFWVGRVDNITDADERHAKHTAEKFRHEYEQWIDYGTPFNPERFKNWKEETLYD